MYTRGWIDHALVRQLLDPMARAGSDSRLRFVQAGQVMSGRERRRATTPSGATLTSAGATGLFAIALAILAKLNDMSSAEPLATEKQAVQPAPVEVEGSSHAAPSSDVLLSDDAFSPLGGKVAGPDSLGPLANEQPAASDISPTRVVSLDRIGNFSDTVDPEAVRRPADAADGLALAPGDVLELDNSTENLFAAQSERSVPQGEIGDAPEDSPPTNTPGSQVGGNPVSNIDAVFTQVVLAVDQMIAQGIDFTALTTEEFQFFTDLFMIFASGWQPNDPAPANAAQLIDDFFGLFGNDALTTSVIDPTHDGTEVLLPSQPPTGTSMSPAETGEPVSVMSSGGTSLSTGDVFAPSPPPSPDTSGAFSISMQPTLLPEQEPPTTE